MSRRLDISSGLAVTEGNLLGELMFASAWKRAAIVAAFVRTEESGGRPKSDANAPLNVSQFAALGIKGLRDRNAVKRYLRAWQSTNLPAPVPGEDIDLPDINDTPFPDCLGGKRPGKGHVLVPVYKD